MHVRLCVFHSPIRCCVDAARADHTRTRKTMKIILKYLFKSTLFIRVIYLFYSFSILFHFIFRIRVRRVSVVGCRWKSALCVWRECVQITVPVTVCVTAGCRCWRMYPNPPLHYDYILHSSHFSSSSPTFFSLFRFVCNSIRVTVENMKQSSKSNREKKNKLFHSLTQYDERRIGLCGMKSLRSLSLILPFFLSSIYIHIFSICIFLSVYRDKVSDAVCIHRYKVAESAQILFDVNVVFFKS